MIFIIIGFVLLTVVGYLVYEFLLKSKDVLTTTAIPLRTFKPTITTTLVPTTTLAPTTTRASTTTLAPTTPQLPTTPYQTTPYQTTTLAQTTQPPTTQPPTTLPSTTQPSTTQPPTTQPPTTPPIPICKDELANKDMICPRGISPVICEHGRRFDNSCSALAAGCFNCTRTR
jgi:hypothetical protein